MTDEFIAKVSERYIELFEHITGDTFIKSDISDIITRIEKNVTHYLLQ